ncbi:site-specific DNA-methyltransferase [Candidatus Amarolinea dominans]|uniref:site-specific DNA-methyltransferase n=1 Tax=Candidatus Amarolinea dominans TaxID=3140696 RepID=UPI0031CC76BB
MNKESPHQTANMTIILDDIARLDHELEHHFRQKFQVQSALTRALVSFQANKTRPVYRWYKYKEAFSAALVEYLFQKYGVMQGKILDPFAGSGTTLFAASSGLDSEGIELLPIGQQIIATKTLLEADFTPEDFETLRRWVTDRVWQANANHTPLPELRITKGAYPDSTKTAIEKYLAVSRCENPQVQTVLRFALLCILEAISYTRKDGQYLRWDYRSGRKQGARPFDKGIILSFDQAIAEKINEMVEDLQPVTAQMSFFPTTTAQGGIHLYDGSCLHVMPTLGRGVYDAIMTSPPYCNRYDYTRTYALELALLGTDEKQLSHLRQEMLSCTVENRAKDLLAMNPGWTAAVAAADGTELLQAILYYLEDQKTRGLLNNNGIPRMVRGYFYEMACIVAECSRVLKPGGALFMVNDNVRYAGASIAVDMILSAIAEKLGFRVQQILVLPNGKGNSSQQMGEHGREELRKCIYVWKKAGMPRAHRTVANRHLRYAPSAKPMGWSTA